MIAGQREETRKCACGRTFCVPSDSLRLVCMECFCTRFDRPQGMRQADPEPRDWPPSVERAYIIGGGLDDAVGVELRLSVAARLHIGFAMMGGGA